MAKPVTTFLIAKMLHVDPGSVANWIDRGHLKAYRTPGGHRRVLVQDLMEFLQSHGMPIPEELANRTRRVLVVDDEVGVTRMIAASIRQAYPECEVLEAHDGFEAGEGIVAMNPDLVILDLKMSGLDGFEVCRRIKSKEGTRHSEVLAMTAYPTRENLDRVLACGARACITKPIEREAMMKEIKACLK